MYKVSKSGQSGLRGNYRISLCVDTKENPDKVASLITNAPQLVEQRGELMSALKALCDDMAAYAIFIKKHELETPYRIARELIAKCGKGEV